MAITYNIESKKNDDRPKISPLPMGIHNAVCYGVWPVGLQKSEYDGKITYNHKIVLGFETDKIIQEEGDYKGKRKVISISLTVSFWKESNLMKYMASWTGKVRSEEEMKSFDFESLIGKPCTLMVTPNKNGNPKITGIMDVMEDKEPLVPELTNEDKPKLVRKMIDEQVPEEDDLPF